MFLLSLALILDWYVGEPDRIWRRIGHPVVWIGRVISWADRLRYSEPLVEWFGADSNRSDLVAGGVLVGVLALLSLLAAWILSFVGALLGPFWWVIEVAVVAVLIAQKSLKEHVSAVALGLKDDGLSGGRRALSQIVGRDVSELDESGVSKAAIESLAENFSDGVVAPALWYLVFGLPGIIFYKAINTADSMVGHRNVKYEFFGKPAAILDDILNWPAARFSALLVALAAGFGQGVRTITSVWETTLRDAPTHRSPNAGWPEAAFAAALGISLGGPRRYGELAVNAATLNASGRPDLRIGDIDRALGLFTLSCRLLLAITVLLWLIF